MSLRPECGYRCVAFDYLASIQSDRLSAGKSFLFFSRMFLQFSNSGRFFPFPAIGRGSEGLLGKIGGEE